MKTKTLVLIFFSIVLLVVITACSSTSTPVPTSSVDGATLVQERCTKCHPLSRVESKRYSAAEWKPVVDLMIEKGAQVTPAEEPVIVSYLAANYGQ